jgi:hypothetical protein
MRGIFNYRNPSKHLIMKTAMQKLLDITYKSISNAKELKLNGLNDQREIEIMLNVYNVYRVIIERDMLEKEKEQIINAYEDGKENERESITNIYKYIIGEYYYNQTYNQNK